MKVKVKKLHPDAVIPAYATEGSSGFDLVALEDVYIAPGYTKLVRTGLSVAVPTGFELQVRPRSGISLKTPLRIANAPGTVDSDYRGEVCIIITNTDGSGYEEWEYMSKDYKITKGERIAQGVICPIIKAEIEVVDDLDATERGEGGFGSTGK
jgi:dUTP pyrophosphatase